MDTDTPSIFNTFQQTLPTLVQKFTNFLDSNRKTTKGRKRQVDLNLFFKAFYSNVRDATSPSNFKYYFGLPKSTYYLKLLTQSRVLELLSNQVTQNYQFSHTLLADTYTVKSHNGSEGVGKSNTDRGRNGIKVQVISDLKGIIYTLETHSANTHDSKVFRNSTITPFQVQKQILMDSAYVGRPVWEFAQLYNLEPLVVPKKKTNGNLTHILDAEQKIKIKQRWRVEQHISILRRFKAISNKFVKQMSTFHTYLSFAKYLINTFHMATKIH